MTVGKLFDMSKSDRELVRNLRGGVQGGGDVMPENVYWHTWVELGKRGNSQANELFLGALRNTHARRAMAGTSLSTHDHDVNEHRMTSDAMLADLWKAYKRCIRNNRIGPAGEILKEIETRLH